MPKVLMVSIAGSQRAILLTLEKQREGSHQNVPLNAYPDK